ncbi:MAG: acriflavin resistance protein [Rhodospirillaceae bacterium]|nr:MAG: acriflavin resistance protein [Rhodospirillaceae bacterium]
MNIIRQSIDRPIAVIAAVLMIVMFGLMALNTIPIQLIPDVRKPVLTITTTWPGAAPAEIEREIVNPQEDVFRGLKGLDEISSSSQTGRARITLEFSVSQDMDKALLLVANRLDQISSYPDEANKPSIRTSSSDDKPIAWFSLVRTDDNTTPMPHHGDFVEDTVQDLIERVPGVSRVNVYGGVKREMIVVISPERMAQFGLTVPQISNALRLANSSASAGDVEEGKRRYIVRTEGKLSTVKQVGAVVLLSQVDPVTGQISRLTVDDIGDVSFGHKKPTATIRRLGEPAMALNVVRESGANVIDTMTGIQAAVTELNATVLPNRGLVMKQLYDETVYINSAIDLVQQNIWGGGTLAAIILLLFLRSAPATLIISLAIPVSVIGSFVAMAALGRSINVISLAGIAFAVGMVVDAAIVVLENIYRLRQQGKSPSEAAYLGAQQVWGAVFVSALTTVLVFTPILIMDIEIGQLFRDIAVAISISVSLSLVVAVTVIPALANRLFKTIPKQKTIPSLAFLDRFAKFFTDAVLKYTRWVIQNRTRAIAVVTIMCGTAAVATVLFLPKLEYLPEGNRNLIFGRIMPPPGYNLKTTTDIAERVENAVRHLWASETGPDSKPGEPPKIDNFFFVARDSGSFLGASSVDPSRVAELIPILRKPIFSEPGTFGFITQPSLFGRTVGGGRSINLDISGPDLEVVLGVALKATGMVGKILPRADGHQIRPRPGLELGAPEVRIYPDPVRLADNGLNAREFSQTVDAFNDGLRVAEITVDGRRIDLTLKGPTNNITQTQGINHLPISTPGGAVLSIGDLANVVITSGPTEIRHIGRERTVTLQIRPSSSLALEDAINMLQSEVIDPLKAEGLPDGMTMRMAGTADKLSEAWNAMVWDISIAVIIVYLVMAILFESFLYPLIIILSVPLATAGGVGGLGFMNLFVHQPLDMLTLLGFIILVGIVVNNAILLVHQTLHHQRYDSMSKAEALVEATRNRIRPIFMSTLTSIFGMLPLVLFPGAGSELYRGLGSVVVGGLSLSAVLTLLMIPPLMALVPIKEHAIKEKSLKPDS